MASGTKDLRLPRDATTSVVSFGTHSLKCYLAFHLFERQHLLVSSHTYFYFYWASWGAFCLPVLHFSSGDTLENTIIIFCTFIDYFHLCIVTSAWCFEDFLNCFVIIISSPIFFFDKCCTFFCTNGSTIRLLIDGSNLVVVSHIEKLYC